MANKQNILGVIILMIALTLSMLLRQKDFNDGIGVRNLEASYHVLLTATALSESPTKNHWFLPTISLGKPQDKNIPWGATIPTETGDFIYTSFTPPGFLAPYIWFNAFSLGPTIKNLANFNVLLGGLGVLLLYKILFSILKINNATNHSALMGSLAGSSIGIFSNEVLTSHGLIYWSQSLYQLIFISSILVLIKVLVEPQNRKYQFILLIAVFFGAATEWTGYVFNLGLVGLFYFTGFIGSHQKLAEKILYITIAAGIFTVAYYGLATDLYSTLRAFAMRFLARSGKTGSIVSLLQGYSLSYGFYLIIIALLLVVNKFNIFSNQQPATSNQQPATSNQQPTTNNNICTITQFVFIASCIPLVENILMLQHASQFTFDRLKFIVPAAFIISIGFTSSPAKFKYLLSILLIFAAAQGFRSYRADLSQYIAWKNIEMSNKKLASEIQKNYDSDCTIYSSNINVRAYANLLFNHGIFERKEISDSTELIRIRHACQIVHIDGNFVFPDIPSYTKATITKADGSVEFLEVESPRKY